MANGKTVLDRHTLVPVGAVILFITSIMGGAGWMHTKLTKIEFEIQGLRKDLVRIETSMGDRWTQTEMTYWAELLQAENPGLKVPVVRDM